MTGKEQFYTPPLVAKSILQSVLERFPEMAAAPFLEPAGGTGAFVQAAADAGIGPIVSLDIEPKHPLVRQGNFLTEDFSIVDALCVTNPPFGRNNSLSVPFFNKAAEHSQVIAFIVPRSWRKWSVINRLDRRFQLAADWDLKIDYLDEHGQDAHAFGNLNTCVQVWIRHPQGLREIVSVQDRNLVSKTSPTEADVSLTVFGYGCGTAKTEFPRVPNTTQMFLKVNDARVYEALVEIDFSRFFLRTAFTPALSLMEINFLLNEALGFGNSVSEDPHRLRFELQ